MTKDELRKAIRKSWRPCCHPGDYVSLPAGTLVIIRQCCEIEWKPNEAAAHMVLAESLDIDASCIEVDEETCSIENYTLRVFLNGVHLKDD